MSKIGTGGVKGWKEVGFSLAVAEVKRLVERPAWSFARGLSTSA